MQEALDRLTEWTKKWCLTINRDKSSSTLFTLSSQKSPTRKLGNVSHPYNNVQTYIGVTFGSQLTWAEQIRKAEAKDRQS